jgi:integrase
VSKRRPAFSRGFSWNGRTKTAEFCVYIKGSGGKRKKRLTIRCSSYDEAQKKWAAFREEHKSANDAVILTLRQYYLKRFSKITSGLKPSTIRGYRHAIEGRLLPVFGDRKLSEISSRLVNDFGRDCIDEGLAPATVNAYVNVLKLLIASAVEDDFLAETPLKKRIRPHKVDPPKLELNEAERIAFLSAFDDRNGFDAYIARTMPRGNVRELADKKGDPFGGKRKIGAGIRSGSAGADAYFDRFAWLKPLFYCFILTGLRRGDALSLRWSEVDLQTGYIKLTTRKKNIDVVLPIAKQLHAQLMLCRKRPVISEFVFTSETGVRLDEKRVQRCFKIAKAIAGIKRRFRIHDARHTYASHLVSHGVTLTVVSALLGHADGRSSLRYARAEKIAAAEMARPVLDRAQEE